MSGMGGRRRNGGIQEYSNLEVEEIHSFALLGQNKIEY